MFLVVAMTDIQSRFFQLLRLSIGVSDANPHIEPEEWPEIYRMAKEQSLVALLFDGVQQIGKEARIDSCLLMKWMGMSLQIEKHNRQMNMAVGKVSAWFLKKGFRSCLLKGQGNALLYPHPLHRMAGDIDVWLEGKPAAVIRFVHAVAPKEKASYHHIDFPAINGIPVEVHYRPCYLLNPVNNHRLQRFFAENAEEQFQHRMDLEGSPVAVPTCQFNIVYQLVHIYNHLFQEGIGLRQIVDYYFVVVNLNLTDKAALQRELRRLGLLKFAGAVMFVLHEVLGLSEEKMIAPMDAGRGRMLLTEILQGGNFGQYDRRYAFGRGAFGHNLQRLYRDWRLVRYYPAEALCEPVFRTWHFFWRIFHSE